MVLTDPVLLPVATHGARLRVDAPVTGVVLGAEEHDQLQLESHPLLVLVVSSGPGRQHGEQGGVVESGLDLIGGTGVESSVLGQGAYSISRSSASEADEL